MTAQIDFPYYFEHGTHADQGPLALGEGLTSQIIDHAQPLLLNRDEHFDRARDQPDRRPRAVVPGRPDPGRRGRDRGDQRPEHHEEAGRFGEADVRLLSTHRRQRRHGHPERPALRASAQRRADEMAALGRRRARDLGARSSSSACCSGSSSGRMVLLDGGHQRGVPARAGGETFRAIAAVGDDADAGQGATGHPGEGSSARSPPRRVPRSSTTSQAIRARRPDPGHRGRSQTSG